MLLYKDYIVSDIWQERRERVLKRDRYKCVMCGSATNLNVHHTTYPHDYENDTDDNCITVCLKCHRKLHKEDLKRKENDIISRLVNAEPDYSIPSAHKNYNTKFEKYRQWVLENIIYDDQGTYRDHWKMSLYYKTFEKAMAIKFAKMFKDIIIQYPAYDMYGKKTFGCLDPENPEDGNYIGNIPDPENNGCPIGYYPCFIEDENYNIGWANDYEPSTLTLDLDMVSDYLVSKGYWNLA
ncbi:MAG: HNH endonuclease [Eubacterium sp.]